MSTPELSLLATIIAGVVGIMATVASAGKKVGSALEDLGHVRASVDALRTKVDKVHDDLISLRAEHDTIIALGSCPTTTRK